MMKRDIESELLLWKDKHNRKPLIILGARQVGKTSTIQNWATQHFNSVITINFEAEPKFKECFTDLDPQTIINKIGDIAMREIVVGESLLFLDEIQECPQAILALRYFKEKLPALHVIAAGSLLEFTLNSGEFRMPVGRVEILHLKPLSFKEFLTAIGHTRLRDFIEKTELNTEIPNVIHTELIKLMHQYTVLGGMPEVIKEYATSGNLVECQRIQTTTLITYRRDFGKYAKQTEHKYLQRVFEKIPSLIAQHFKYSKVDPDSRARDLRGALDMLTWANIVYPVYATVASGLPLIGTSNDKKFKVIFLDVGLAIRNGSIDLPWLFKEDLLLVNRGALAEQIVGQELVAYTWAVEEPRLYFWCREMPSSSAEVDYVTVIKGQIIPIEVKAGGTGRLKSLHLFLQEKNLPLGVRISELPLKLEKNILSVPLYLIGELPRLVAAAA